MARSRNIKPGFFKNEVLATLDPYTRLLFIGLWTCSDRSGRFEVRLEKLKAEIFPHEQVMLEPCMTQLWDKHFLTFFEADGKRFAQVNNWSKHQSPHHKEVESEIPEPTTEKVFANESDMHAWLIHGSCMNQSRFKQNASSPLIPDSLNLIPDSLPLGNLPLPCGEHADTKPKSCPVESIIALFREKASRLVQPKIVTDATRAAISARWRQDTKHQSLEFWDRFFEYCNGTPLLAGDVPSKTGGKPFKAGLEWVVTAGNFAKIINGNYDDEVTA